MISDVFSNIGLDKVDPGAGPMERAEAQSHEMARILATILSERVYGSEKMDVYMDGMQAEKLSDEEALVSFVYKQAGSDWWKRVEFKVAEGGPDGFYVKGALKLTVMGENGETE